MHMTIAWSSAEYLALCQVHLIQGYINVSNNIRFKFQMNNNNNKRNKIIRIYDRDQLAKLNLINQENHAR